MPPGVPRDSPTGGQRGSIPARSARRRRSKMSEDNIAHDRGDGPRHPIQIVTTPSGSVYAQMTPPPGARPATNLVLDLTDALKLKLAEAMSIIGHAMMLRQSGQNLSSPGWSSFDHRADEFMRVTPRS